MESELQFFPEEVYQRLSQEGQLLTFPDCIFQSSTWLKGWLDNTPGGERTRVHHNLRMVIQYGTLSAFTRGEYSLEDGTKVQLDLETIKERVLKTKLYKEAVHLELSPQYNTTISVIEGDCLEVAKFFQDQGNTTFCINMANAHTPGGGFMHGAGAQEESLHRRTGLFQCLKDPQKIQGRQGGSYNYPIPIDGVIYSPNVIVIRASEAKGYKFLEQPYTMNFVSCAALVRPSLRAGGLKLDYDAADTMKNKMRAILSVGLENGNTVAVLSAIGCGAFRNPPRHIAHLFKKVIQREFNGAYKHIVFAIYNDHNAKGEGNVKPFADAFETTVETLEEKSKDNNGWWHVLPGSTPENGEQAKKSASW